MPIEFHIVGIFLGLALLIGSDRSRHQTIGLIIFGLACFSIGGAR